MNYCIDIPSDILSFIKSNFKDYIYPIFGSFFSAVLGGVVAFMTFKRQDVHEGIKHQIGVVNDLTIQLEEARSVLFSFKRHYYKDINNNPIERAAGIHFIGSSADNIKFPFHELSFIAPKKGKDCSKCNQIPYIKSIIQNYNLTLSQWNLRNQEYLKFTSYLSERFGAGAIINLPIDALRDTRFEVLIDLTEQVIALTDFLILEIEQFLNTFPGHIKSIIKYKKVKSTIQILSYQKSTSPEYEKLLLRTSEPDFSHMENNFAPMIIQSTKERYTWFTQSLAQSKEIVK